MSYADFIAQFVLARYQLPGTEDSIKKFITMAENVANELLDQGYLNQ